MVRKSIDYPALTSIRLPGKLRIDGKGNKGESDAILPSWDSLNETKRYFASGSFQGSAQIRISIFQPSASLFCWHFIFIRLYIWIRIFLKHNFFLQFFHFM